MSDPESDTPDEDGEDVPNQCSPSRDRDGRKWLTRIFPVKDEWSAKTLLDENDPAAIAALRSFAEIYPEVDQLQPLIDRFLDDYMRTKTSIEGRSREEYRKILMGMFGASDGDDESFSAKLVAADEDE